MLNSILGTELTLTSFLICTGVSLLLGVGTALVAGYRSRSTQSLAVTLAILPAVVQAVIMLVNGSIGAGIAVAGAFSLVRFRSAPGTAREIAAISWLWPLAWPPVWGMWGWRRCCSSSWPEPCWRLPRCASAKGGCRTHLEDHHSGGPGL